MRSSRACRITSCTFCLLNTYACVALVSEQGAEQVGYQKAAAPAQHACNTRLAVAARVRDVRVLIERLLLGRRQRQRLLSHAGRPLSGARPEDGGLRRFWLGDSSHH